MKCIASFNGLKAAGKAFEIVRDGGSPLDACVDGVTLIEDDPDELTVGFGGLPNEEGVVELDAAVMDGRSHRGGGVACLRGIRHPTKVARLVMQQTSRVLLSGEGALRFALANGFREENLLTDRARSMWLYWKRIRSSLDDWQVPQESEIDAEMKRWFEKHYFGDTGPEGSQLANKLTGTVHCAALDGNGDLSCATSTSGHAFKIAGRVGDSPILGAGLYVDNEVGTCGSIGNGEANLENLSSFLAVELMRGGMSPEQAGLETLRRVLRKSRNSWLDDQGGPTFNLQLFLLNKDGRCAGVSMRPGKQFVVTDEQGTRLFECTPL
jgi:N4-(beta-N-acetylglucosaminyl)-L-asparaginase